MTSSEPTDSSRSLSPKARQFLEAPRYAVAATLNADGSPLGAVIWYALDGDTIVFNSRAGRLWPNNLRRDPRISITVAEGEDYVEFRGEVEIDEDPSRGQESAAALARRYEPDEAAAVRHIEAFSKQHRITLLLHPSHIYERFLGIR